MVETVVANYIADNTSFQKGVDLCIGPMSYNEGISVEHVMDFHGFYPLERARIAVFIAYKSYKTAKQHAETLSALLSNYQGTSDGTWSVTGDVETIRFGMDEKRRNVFIVNFTVAYDAALV